MTAKRIVLLPERHPLIQINCIPKIGSYGKRKDSPEFIDLRKTPCQSTSGLGASVRTSESCERCPVGRRERWDGSIPKFH
jgi:hypothetical protein